MKSDNNFFSGSSIMLILKMVETKDMYGYEMIEELRQRSDNVFELKAGTLYPILHDLTAKKLLKSYVRTVDGKERKYYSLTDHGKKYLQDKKEAWIKYSDSMNKVMEVRLHGC